MDSPGCGPVSCRFPRKRLRANLPLSDERHILSLRAGPLASTGTGRKWSAERPVARRWTPKAAWNFCDRPKRIPHRNVTCCGGSWGTHGSSPPSAPPPPPAAGRGARCHLLGVPICRFGIVGIPIGMRGGAELFQRSAPGFSRGLAVRALRRLGFRRRLPTRQKGGVHRVAFRRCDVRPVEPGTPFRPGTTKRVDGSSIPGIDSWRSAVSFSRLEELESPRLPVEDETGWISPRISRTPPKGSTYPF